VSKILIFVFLFFLSTSCSIFKNKTTRRSDFVAGCFSGISINTYEKPSDSETNRIINYCLYIYDSNKIKMDKILDSTSEDIEKIPPVKNFKFENEKDSSDESEHILYI
jgi:hypothetical protein